MTLTIRPIRMFALFLSLFIFMPFRVFAEPVTDPVITIAAPDPVITIAVRKDARPFVWVEENEDKVSYEGFFVKICLEAARRARYTPEMTTIDATERTIFFENGEFGGDKKKVNLLCDPTTITLERMDRFAAIPSDKPRLQFSPIVFVANGSFVERKDLSDDLATGVIEEEILPETHCKSVVEKAESGPTPANCEDDEKKKSGKQEESWWRPADWLPVVKFMREFDKPKEVKKGRKFEVWGYVKGSTIGDAVLEATKRVPETTVICPRVFNTHSEAAKAYCDGQLVRYFGDVEIVKFALSEIRRTKGLECPADMSNTQKGTYEPYAFVLASTDEHPDFPTRFTRALYSMFSDGRIDKLFEEQFSNSRKSAFLSTLFRIQSIPRGNLFPGGKVRPE